MRFLYMKRGKSSKLVTKSLMTLLPRHASGGGVKVAAMVATQLACELGIHLKALLTVMDVAL
jgi:hypothetical protein